MFRTLSGRYSFTTSSNTSLVSNKSTRGSIPMILSVYNYFFSGTDQNVRPFSTNNPIMSSDVTDLFHPRQRRESTRALYTSVRRSMSSWTA